MCVCIYIYIYYVQTAADAPQSAALRAGVWEFLLGLEGQSHLRGARSLNKHGIASWYGARPYIYIYVYMYLSLSLYIYICIYI